MFAKSFTFAYNCIKRGQQLFHLIYKKRNKWGEAAKKPIIRLSRTELPIKQDRALHVI